MKKQRLLEGLTAALLLGALGACGDGDAAEAADTDASELAVVERGNLDIRVEAAGTVEPILLVEVKSKASGEITALHVENGDEVERGDLLAEVDPRDVRNALAQAEADLEVAQARVQIAQSQAARSRELREANVVTDQELESSVLEAANARASLIKAETNLELAQERMGDVRIQAPLTGTIIDKQVEAGQIIASASGNVSGGTVLLNMADLSTMQVRTLVDETDIGKVKPGQVARVQVEAYPNRTFVGSVYRIEPQAVVEQNVTMFPVLVRMDNEERLLKPNMNAEVQIEVAQRNDVLLVSNAAVVGTTDAMAAAQVLGVDEDDMREAMMGGGARPQQLAMAESDEGGSAPAGGAPAGQGSQAAGGTDGAAQSSASSSSPDGSAGAPDCQTLMAKARQDRSSLTDEERTQMRSCFQQMGGAGGMRGARAGASGGDPDTRPAFLFVRTANGIEPRQVVLGLNDWDRSEVVSGVEAGEKVILVSVARLQAQQEEMMNRIRERSSPIPGGGR